MLTRGLKLDKKKASQKALLENSVFSLSVKSKLLEIVQEGSSIKKISPHLSHYPKKKGMKNEATKTKVNPTIYYSPQGTSSKEIACPGTGKTAITGR